MSLKTWYEAASKYVIPAIRALVAEKLTSQYGYSQVKASEALGVSQPAISNYLKGKRGKIGIDALRSDETIMAGVDKIAYCIHRNDLGCVNDIMDNILLYIKTNKQLLEALLPREYRGLIGYWSHR